MPKEILHSNLLVRGGGNEMKLGKGRNLEHHFFIKPCWEGEEEEYETEDLYLGSFKALTRSKKLRCASWRWRCLMINTIIHCG